MAKSNNEEQGSVEDQNKRERDRLREKNNTQLRGLENWLRNGATGYESAGANYTIALISQILEERGAD